MRIRPYLPGDLKKLRSSFPSLKTKPTVRGAAVVWEDDGDPLAFAWAEPQRGAKHHWELRFLGALKERQGLGLESQVLITLELEIEKRAGKALSVWTAADMPDSGGDFIRDMVRPRGYRFREYDAVHFGEDAPGDRYEKELYPDDFPQGQGGPGEDDEGDGGKESRYHFPLLSLN